MPMVSSSVAVVLRRGSKAVESAVKVEPTKYGNSGWVSDKPKGGAPTLQQNQGLMEYRNGRSLHLTTPWGRAW